MEKKKKFSFLIFTQEKFSEWPVALLLIFILFLYSYNLTGWLIHDDEGSYLYQAWRMTEGEITP